MSEIRVPISIGIGPRGYYEMHKMNMNQLIMVYFIDIQIKCIGYCIKMVGQTRPKMVRYTKLVICKDFVTTTHWRHETCESPPVTHFLCYDTCTAMAFNSVLPLLLPTHSVDCAVHLLLSHSRALLVSSALFHPFTALIMPFSSVHRAKVPFWRSVHRAKVPFWRSVHRAKVPFSDGTLPFWKPGQNTENYI